MALTEHGYTDDNFTAGDSPRILAPRDDMSGTALFDKLNMVAVCDGPGAILIQVSQAPDGEPPVFDHSMGTMEEGEEVTLKEFTIGHLKITHSGVDSAYRILIYA